MSRPLIKICCIDSVEEARLAAEAGASGAALHPGPPGTFVDGTQAPVEGAAP